jgi:hypothetical protein
MYLDVCIQGFNQATVKEFAKIHTLADEKIS